MLIHVKEKEQTVRTNYVVVLSMHFANPYFVWNRPHSYRHFFFFFSRTSSQMKTRQENVNFWIVWRI